jgi:hypothetical protein
MCFAFHLAQRARCAAAIFLRPASDIVRFLIAFSDFLVDSYDMQEQNPL